jgi:hypothetical protein
VVAQVCAVDASAHFGELGDQGRKALDLRQHGIGSGGIQRAEIVVLCCQAGQRGSATPCEEGGHGLAVGGRERLCINSAQVGAFVFGEVRRTGMGSDESVNDLGQRGARGGVKAGVGAFHQGLKAGIHTGTIANEVLGRQRAGAIISI